MSLKQATKDVFDMLESTKTPTGFWVLTTDMLKAAIHVAHLQGEIDGGQTAQARLDEIIDGAGKQ